MEQAIEQTLKKQRAFFQTNQTKPLAYRKEQLLKLYQEIEKREDALCEALQKDLGKSMFEAYTTEVGIIKRSITQTVKHLKKWTKPQRVKTTLAAFPGNSKILLEPLGSVYIIVPFNYPFQLAMEPLIGALASGNCAVLKPSEQTPAVSALIEEIIEAIFDESYVKVYQGAREVNELLLKQRFDLVFFTGSPQVGKIVMQAAAKHLTPVILELGGKSPAIVTAETNIKVAAERIAWGKCLNAGQTCIAPDYVYVDQTVEQEFLQEMTKAIKRFYGDAMIENPEYGRLVNHSSYKRIEKLISDNVSLCYSGGKTDEDQLFVEPTIFSLKTTDSSLMETELFGPLLPVLPYNNIEDVITYIKAGEKPLALYLFTKNKAIETKILSEISFGGGIINNTIVHAANEHLPFGGVGNSGMGNYHGRYSIDAFSHHKSVIKQSTVLKFSLVFPPYTEKMLKLVRRVLK